MAVSDAQVCHRHRRLERYRIRIGKDLPGNEYDVLIAADEPEIEQAAATLRQGFGTVEAVQADLSGPEGVDRLYAAAKGRQVDALLANAGRGLGRGFLDQDPESWRHVVDTNITGTLLLVQKVGRDMRRSGEGRILITGSIAGFIPGTYQAVYNGTKAFLDSFSFALRHELKDTGVSVTCLTQISHQTKKYDLKSKHCRAQTDLGTTRAKVVEALTEVRRAKIDGPALIFDDQLCELHSSNTDASTSASSRSMPNVLGKDSDF